MPGNGFTQSNEFNSRFVCVFSAPEFTSVCVCVSVCVCMCVRASIQTIEETVIVKESKVYWKGPVTNANFHNIRHCILLYIIY